MAPKGKSKKDKGSTTGKKKAKSGLDGQEQKKTTKVASTKKKAWGKDKGIHEDNDDIEGAGHALKSVRIKLDQEGCNAILDILHQLHVDGAEDGAKDDDDDSEDENEEEEEDDDEGEQEEQNSSGDDSGEEDRSDAVEIDDSDGDGDEGFPGKQGHGDFEYDGTFGDMANLTSDMVVNDTALPSDATNGDETKARDPSGVATTSKKLPGSDEPGGASRSGQGRSIREKDIEAATVSGKTPQQGLVQNALLGGSGATGKITSSANKGALRSKVAREKLLASMVQEDRKLSKQERPGIGGVPSAAIKAASTVGGSPVGGGVSGYRRPDQPGAGSGNDKVRLVVCAEKKKTGAPDLNGKKLLVFSRREPIQKFLNTCRGKLKIGKKAKGAALLEGEEVVDWLSDLSWVPNGAVVLISCNGAGGPKKGTPPPRKDGDAALAAPADVAVNGNTPTAVGDGEGPEQAENHVEEDEAEVLALAALGRIRESYKMRTRGRQSEMGRGGTGESAEDAGKRMAEARRAKEGTAQFRQMMGQRQSLPAYSQREDIVRTIRDNQVVVLSGETGCGKTTQVPQFVLDGLIDQGQGGKCNIVCTQPRRISAVGVADRVASERCERVGGTVGYQIRLDSQVGPSTRLTFCTTGILLRRLTSDGMLAGVSHVMVDEVHERDLQTDFLLSILRDLLPKRPDLRVVLMSATLQADLFTKYFNSCPAITIPGRTFPVEITYLDSVNRLVKGRKAQTLMPRVSSGPEAATVRGAGSAHANPGGRGTSGRRPPRRGGDDDAVSVAYDPLTGEPLESTGDRAAVSAMVSPKCEDKVDYEIMVDLIDHIMKTEGGASEGGGGGKGGRGSSNDQGRTGGRGNAGRQGQQRGRGQSNSRGAAEAAVQIGDGEPLGAILVFLPGFAEIDQLVRALERHPRIGRGSRIFPLHSSLPPVQQKSIFQRMPPGVRKIVVSTNIAETSVTIDDCTHVIDAGRVREMRYDPATRMSCLLEVWISKASGSQRAGRAGRVRPGKCWRLYPQAFHDINMPTHTLAEMLRTPLEELVLQVLLLELGSPADFLARAVEPPPPKMLRAALRNLYDLQAIVISKSTPILTPLGYHLAQLPMDARVGKLLLIAATLQCLDPILTIAAALSDKAPFQRPFGEQSRADAARQRFAQHKSDHLAIVDAFGAWRNKRRTCSESEVRWWCRENFLSVPTLERLDSIRKQFRRQLCEVGFAAPVVPNNRASGRDAAAAGGFSAESNNWRNKKGEEIKTMAAWERDGSPTPQDSDKNAGNISLVQSVLVAGLYPHVAAFRGPNSKLKMRKGHFVTRDDVEPSFVHPSSVNHLRFSDAAEIGRQVWIVYHSKMKTKQVYLQDSTYATPFSLMLWGARVRHERPLGKKHAVEVVIDRWLRFRMTESTAVVFKAMRRELSNLLVRKIEAPHADPGPLPGMLVSCLVRLLEIESRNPYNT